MVSPLIRSIRARLHIKNQNWMCAVVGETGSGKSYSGLTMAKLIDPDFKIGQVVFTPQQFMELLNSGKLKKGSAIVFDEAGVGMPAREWHNIQNKLLGYILQTFRHENLAVLFTLPSMSMIDIQARKLFHCIIRTLAVNYRKKHVKTQLFLNQANPIKDMEYRKYARTLNSSEELVKISRYLIPRPPNYLIAHYERRKTIYAKELKVSVEATMKGRDKKPKEPQVTKRMLVEKELRKGKLNAPQIAKKVGCTANYVRTLKSIT